MPLEAIQYGPYTGGVRYDVPVEQVAANELNQMQNCRLGTGGEVEHRPGTASYQSAATIGATTVITAAASFRVDASTTEVVMIGGTKIYKYNSGWSDISGAVTITPGNVFAPPVNANGTLVVTNGVDTDAIKWTGTGNASALDDDSRFSKGKHAAWFDNRLWIGNVNGATNQLWYSDTADIETWGATSFYRFGGEITGLVATQNALAVHTTDGIYTLIPTGSATLPYHPQKRTDEAGVDGKSVVALPDDTQLMILEDGVYQWRGGAELVKVSPQLDGDSGYWSNLNTGALTNAFAVRIPKSYVVAFALPYGGSQSVPNQIMFYDYRRRTIVNGQEVGIWYGPDTGNERYCAAVISNKLHMGGGDGILWDHEDSGNADNGSAIYSFFETGAPSPYGPDVTVGWVNARHYYDAVGAYEMTVQQRGADIIGSTDSVDLSGNTLTLPGAIPAYISDPSQFPQDTPLLDYAPQTSLFYSMNAAGQDYTFRGVQLWFDAPARSTRPQVKDE